jgi:hypothetical protein
MVARRRCGPEAAASSSFAKGDTLFAAPVGLGGTFTSGAGRRLFSGPYGFDEVTVNYDVAPDGQRFLVPPDRPRSSHSIRAAVSGSRSRRRTSAA